ncbi:hypothetical protein [Flavobacterium algicola]|uniref:hypothetical protein n=1 Tax=Flavobacterium algicola TaxID=556529 RepID=UPI001EFD1E2A|nr:hypothetical protein [Flavobacterium algicola]MCG9791958.1 hypothetical protein [Flavobacterium algicola]
MENMLNRIVKSGWIAILFLASFVSHAHQAEFSSSLLSKTDDGKYILQIASSMTAFQGEIDYIYTQKAYKTPEEFKKLVIDYFNKNVSFIVNGTEVLKFKDPVVLLGHETKLIVEVLNIPEVVNEITFTNTMFKDMSHNKMGLIMLIDNFPKEQYVLENENEQSINLSFEDGIWVDTATTGFKAKNIFYILGFLVLAAVPLFYFSYLDRKYLRRT